MHVHTRVPGNEDAEDFKSLEKAALSSGVTSILAMPNTLPALDNLKLLRTLKEKTKNINLNVFFAAAITKKREGKKLVNFYRLKSEGVVAFTDDGSWLESKKLMRRALELSSKTGTTILSHCQYPYKNKNAPINDGYIAKIKKIPGIPRESEKLAILRDILLAIKTNGKLHIQHISLLDSVKLIEIAKSLAIQITCETCPHYFWFTEEKLENLDTNFKMNPPLRTEKDRKAIIDGIKNGIIDVICSDHAPHTKKSKSLGIYKSPFGVIGLETLLPATLTMLYHREKISLAKLVEVLSNNPAKILNLKNKGSLKPGFDADISIIDLNKRFKIEKFFSKSENSSFKEVEFKGKNLITVVSGKKVYENGKFYL